MYEKWISVKQELPAIGERVMIWFYLEDNKEGYWTECHRMEIPDCVKYDYYFDNFSNTNWAMGNVRNYKVTHFCRVEGPNS